MMRNAYRDQSAGRRRKGSEGGFTIIELLIATLVFSMVLLLITIGVITFTKSYFKGLTQSKTQNTARTVIEAISQSIQFSGGNITTDLNDDTSNGSKGFCIGDTRYSFIKGYQLVEGAPDGALKQSRHSLVRDEPGNCGGAEAQDVRGTVTGDELLAPGMRISKLDVEQIGATPMYKVSIRIVYGDDDLLCSPQADDCAADGVSGNLESADDLNCKVSFSGSQFCAAAELSTVVKKRIVQNP